MARIIEVRRSAFESNDEVARHNRRTLADAGVIAVNMMASPGAGKTSLILATSAALAGKLRFGVVEGDVAGDLDARAVEAAGLPVVQVNTGGACHLRADMLKAALQEMPLQDIDVLWIENVGNLVCPAGVDLGESLRVVVSSTPEGHDKPIKYPGAFRVADAVAVSKWDLAASAGFDLETYASNLRKINSGIRLFCLSALTGEGMAEWVSWMDKQAGAVAKDV